MEELQRCKWRHPLIIDIKDDRRKEIVSWFCSSVQSDDEHESDSEVESISTEDEQVF